MFTIKIGEKTNTCSTPTEALGILKARNITVSEGYAKLIKKMGVGSTVHISGPVTRDVKASVHRNS